MRRRQRHVPHVEHRHTRGAGSGEHLRGAPDNGVPLAYVLVDADLRVVDQDGGPAGCAHLRDSLRHINPVGPLHAASMAEPPGPNEASGGGPTSEPVARGTASSIYGPELTVAISVARPTYVRLGLPFVSAYGDAGLGLLGDPTRRAVFELLARRPCSVQELADQLPISRPAVSQHLRVLKDGGLVVSHAEGNRRIYRLNPVGVTALRTWLDGVWSDALAGFHKVAEATEAPHDSALSDPEPEQEV